MPRLGEVLALPVGTVAGRQMPFELCIERVNCFLLEVRVATLLYEVPERVQTLGTWQALR